MPSSDPPDAARLTELLVQPGSLWQHVQVVSSTGSTNADLVTQARAGAKPGRVLVAEHQTAGRGRLSREWTAPPGSSIAMSVLVRPESVDTSRWTWLPLLAGLAVAEGLRRGTGVAAMLKWPNDVLVNDLKISGILAERVQTDQGPACVIGCGINVSQTADELPAPTATSLVLQSATTINKSTIVVTILRAFALLYQHWQSTHDDAAFASSYLSRCTTIGRRVRVQVADRVVEGIADAIDSEGRLVVRTDDGLEAFAAGDVVHLR